MEKSIENIWKEGFQAEEQLSAPKISNLYKMKSKLLLQQIYSRSKKDNLSLIPVAMVIFGVFAFMGKFMVGLYLAILIFSLFFLNKKTLKTLENLDVKSNTYSYLTTYRDQIKIIIRKTNWLLGIGLPLVIIPGFWIFFQGTQVLAKFNRLDLGIRFLIILGLAVVLSILGILCYRLSAKIIYGNLLENLKNTIEDMEELMKT